MAEQQEIVIRYGTPKPVIFRETMGTNIFDVDLAARSFGNIHVSGYDTEKYPDEEALGQAVRTGIMDMIEKCLGVMSEKSVMRSDPQRRLADLLGKELSEIGIEAKVEVLSFVLDEDSEQIFQKMKEELKKGLLEDLAVDRTDRPYIKPDCVPPPPIPADGSLGGFMSMVKRDKFCRKCGNQLGSTDNYCRECGAQVVVSCIFGNPLAPNTDK